MKQRDTLAVMGEQCNADMTTGTESLLEDFYSELDADGLEDVLERD